MKIKNVKGGYDYLPKEQKIKNYINEILKETFEQYGYNPIETPILCYYDILSGKYEEENDILKEIYKLKDQGNRSLGLRYDLTVPFAKFIALNKNEIKLPFKRYEIAKVFRDGPVKLGRNREFTQCDVDVVGISNQLIEVELINLYIDAFKKLDIDIIIKYNNRKLTKGLILETNINKELISRVITILDKKEKITKEELIENLINLGLNSNKIKTLLTYFNLSLEELNQKFKDTKNINIKEGLKELNNLYEYINYMNIEKYCTFSPTLARGQDYYTGNVFEVYEKNSKLNCSIGGGGRYDKMIGEFVNDENNYPAVGISFGLTPIYEILKDREYFKEMSIIDIYIIPINTKKESISLATKLRNLGYKLDLEMNDNKLRKSMDYANKEKIKYVIIYGEDEVKKQSFKLKDMNNYKEYKIDINNLEKIKKIIKK